MSSSANISMWSKRYRMQILVATVAHIMTFTHGISLGWLSPIIQVLQSSESPLNFTITTEQVSWIGSLFGIGFLVGNIFFGLTLDRLGRKLNMYLLAIPHILFWVLSYAAQSIDYLYASRFFAGFTSSGLYVVIPIFISEFSDKEIRGALTAMAMGFLSTGILVGYALPAYLDYFLVPCIIIILPIIYLIAAWAFPETPQCLLKRGRTERAENSFNFYKSIPKREMVLSHKYKRDMELPEPTMPASSEFDELKEMILSGGLATPITIKDFLTRSAMFKFFTAFIICILNQFSSSFVFVSYMSAIFASSGSTMDPNECTIYMGVVEIAGTVTSTVLVERFGRKVLFLTSTATMAASMFAFGIFVQFTDESTKAQYEWAPVVLMALVVYTAAFGVVGLTYTIIVEILPAKIRGQAQAISMIFMSICVFGALHLYPMFLYNYGLPVTMYSCTGVCIVCGIYLIIFLEETRGKSMEQD
ncbi:facilitated trehalose transporter Tret1-like isoform X1 [Anastrepha ludens]|uniref:facilitated trehalose transporter Tret1-like isoform X1 n=2 Tax=Anastrepha ludens TaxID=28586 RepID=UPI0023B034F7|nr:facilitated trehalose transporter Tret1-like isoform X1 [Anastrepha ludens]